MAPCGIRCSIAHSGSDHTAKKRRHTLQQGSNVVTNMRIGAEVGNEVILPGTGPFTALLAGANNQQRHFSTRGIRQHDGFVVQRLAV
jgi:hypothetical protein